MVRGWIAHISAFRSPFGTSYERVAHGDKFSFQNGLLRPLCTKIVCELNSEKPFCIQGPDKIELTAYGEYGGAFSRKLDR